MTNHHLQPNSILRLTQEELNDPRQVVHEFFMNYHLRDVREVLWEWLWAGLANSNHLFQTPMDRSNLLFLYENLEKLLEANYVLKKKAERKARRSKRKRHSINVSDQAAASDRSQR